MNKVYIDWETFGIMIDKLAEKINENHKGTFDGVYGVPRGGLPIATVLSHKLGLPLLLYPNKKSLICDDISDTGKTLQSHKNKFIATLHSTEWTTTKPDCFIEMKKKKTDWIVYPWEIK
tara:strand:- start:114 stop:470 length:357 start_codon:yes stop_codon:yes gene_type:complete